MKWKSQFSVSDWEGWGKNEGKADWRWLKGMCVRTHCLFSVTDDPFSQHAVVLVKVSHQYYTMHVWFSKMWPASKKKISWKDVLFYIVWHMTSYDFNISICMCMWTWESGELPRIERETELQVIFCLSIWRKLKISVLYATESVPSSTLLGMEEP